MHSNKGRQSGFSMVEILVVVAIIAVIAAMAVPTLVGTMNNYRLDASGHAVASILAQTRLQAVRNNFAAYAQYNAGPPSLAYINSDPSVAYTLGNPDVEIASATFQASNLPNHDQLDAYLSNGNASTSVTAEIGTVIGFNARGLPCMETSAGNPLLCWQQDPTNTNTVPYFEWFMQGSNGGWEAVTVSPAGRIKAWRLGSGTGCGYTACWE